MDIPYALAEKQNSINNNTTTCNGTGPTERGPCFILPLSRMSKTIGKKSRPNVYWDGFLLNDQYDSDPVAIDGYCWAKPYPLVILPFDILSVSYGIGK